jgi:hypothetical protein
MKEIVSVRPLLEKIKDELRALVAAEARLHENRDEIFLQHHPGATSSNLRE